MAKKKTTEKALNIDNILFNCRDYLRAARNSGSFFEKRDMMLTLVFLRFIGEKYEDGIENLKQTLKEQGLDPEDENIRAAFFDDATFADGTYNLPPEARWSTIISTPAPQLNVALDTALQRLEEEDPQLKGCFVKGTFTARNLAANDIKKIVDEVNKISHKTFGEEKDLIGRVYEYFLKEFAVNATKEEGEFYTPHDVVQLIATMIEPYDGTLAAKSFQEMLEKTIAEYHERRKHLTAEEAGEAQEQASEDIIKIATEQALAILRQMNENRESFRKIGLTFEEKAFYDILISLRDQYNFEYGTDKEVDGVIVNDKCKALAKKIKDIIDTKSSFADWLNNQNVRNGLKLEIKICLVKNGYPPQYSPEVFNKVMEQVENFEEYSVTEGIGSEATTSGKIYEYEPEHKVMMVAEDPVEYGKE